MNKKVLHKKNLYAIATLLILVAAAAILYAAIQRTGLNIAQPVDTQKTSDQTSKTADETKPTNSVLPSLSYGEALKTYGDKRIQFSINYNNACVAIPISSAFKSGTKIMLDNRSGKNLSIALDGVVSNIKAYGFKIITLSSKYALPHTIKIDCNGGRSVSQIVLQ